MPNRRVDHTLRSLNSEVQCIPRLCSPCQHKSAFPELQTILQCWPTFQDWQYTALTWSTVASRRSVPLDWFLFLHVELRFTTVLAFCWTAVWSPRAPWSKSAVAKLQEKRWEFKVWSIITVHPSTRVLGSNGNQRMKWSSSDPHPWIRSNRHQFKCTCAAAPWIARIRRQSPF